MKLSRKLFTNYFAIFVLSALFLSCGGGDDNDNVEPDGYYLKYKTQGKDCSFKPTDSMLSGSAIGSTSAGTSSSFSVTGIKKPGPYPSMSFMVKTNDGIGSKEFKSNDALIYDTDFLIHFTIPNDDPLKKYDLYQLSTGITVTITEITKESIRGTFSLCKCP